MCAVVKLRKSTRHGALTSKRIRFCQNINAGGGDEDFVFEMRGVFAIGGDNGPIVGKGLNVA